MFYAVNEISNENSAAWYNFRNGQYDYLYKAPENFEDYIPQSETAQGLYKCYLDLGDQPNVAAMKVLKASLGIKTET